MTENREIERWARIEDFPLYEVSSFGNIRNSLSGVLLKPQKNQGGNRMVRLRHLGETSTRGVARIVCTAFNGAPDEDDGLWPQNTPMHLDHDRDNCYASNLIWRPRWYAIQYMQEWSNGPTKEPNRQVIDLRTAQVYSNAFEAGHELGILERFVNHQCWNNFNDPEHYRQWAFYSE